MKTISYAALALFTLLVMACKGETKTKASETNAVEMTDKKMDNAGYTIVQDSTKVHFTAYKTTDKLPVGGDFLKTDLVFADADSPKDIINGLEFSIPVSGLFTNDATKTRDPKILEFFFGAMMDTELLKGKFQVVDDKTCNVRLTMNGTTATLPMSYTMDGEQANFTGTLDLKEWKALDALASLNKVCKELHTGADGVSKTWEDVAINASLLFKKN